MGLCWSSDADEGDAVKGKAAQEAPSAAGAACGANCPATCAAGAGHACCPAAATAAPPADGGASAHSKAASAAGAASPDGGSGPLARPSSSNGAAPLRSALRTSIDGGAVVARKSINGSEGSGPPPRVRFAANTHVEEHERSEQYAASDSVSLTKVVDVFYAKVLADPRLAPYFATVDVPKLKSHQVKFMALAFGGKELVLDEHPDLNLRRIHWKLIKDRGLTEKHWEIFYDRFKEALDDLPEIPEDTKRTAIASVATTRVYFRPIDPREEAAAAAAAAAGGGGNGAAAAPAAAAARA